jgi:hypothetical protein
VGVSCCWRNIFPHRDIARLLSLVSLRKNMATEQRIYKVISGGKTHLVQAASQAQALRHVASKTFSVEVAKAIDVANLMGKGVALEIASLVAEQSTLEGV